MAKKNNYIYKVEPQDVDYTHRVRLSKLGRAILNAAGIDAQKSGIGIDTLNKDRYTWVLSRMAIELDSMLGQYAPYTVSTWVNEYNRALSTRNFVLSSEDKIFGRAITQWCMFDLDERSLVDLNKLEGHDALLVDAPSPMSKPCRLGAIEPEKVEERTIKYSDIDFNGHVNTLRYIEMMLDMLPMEVFKEGRGLRFDIHFIAECRYGQSLSVGYLQSGEVATFEIKRCDGEVVVRASLEFK